MEISLNSFVAGYSVYQTPPQQQQQWAMGESEAATGTNTYFSQTRRLKSELYKAEKRFYFSLVVTPLSAYQYLGLGVSGSRNLCYPFHSLATEPTPWHSPLFPGWPHWPPCYSIQTPNCSSLQGLHLLFSFCLECSFPSWSSWLVPSAPQSHLLKDTFPRCLI